MVRRSAGSAIGRVELATALVGADWLIDVFVEEARTDGVSWSELAGVMASSGGCSVGGAVSDDAGDTARSSEVMMQSNKQHEGKYRPLWEHLVNSKETRLQMSFEDVERVLGFPLPPSSRDHQPHWYGYKGSAVARSIIDAGWKAQKVDLASEQSDTCESDRAPSVNWLYAANAGWRPLIL